MQKCPSQPLSKHPIDISIPYTSQRIKNQCLSKGNQAPTIATSTAYSMTEMIISRAEQNIHLIEKRTHTIAQANPMIDKESRQLNDHDLSPREACQTSATLAHYAGTAEEER